jgi:hypothetical protein
MARYLFIGGMHRSGTSLLARIAAAHPEVAGIGDSPAPENEGCYLQGAIPHTALHGRPMHYATDPDQHLVEGGRFDRLETRQRMEADWAQWFDPACPWRVEKSPVNLTRMRLYQQLFPMAQFAVILRHPEYVAAATGKWVDMPRAEMVAHWLAAHERLRADLDHLHSVLVIRYEDLCRDPARYRRALHLYLGLAPDGAGEELRDGNQDYPDPRGLGPGAAEDWGYGPLGAVHAWRPLVRHPLRAVREAVQECLDD